MYINPKVIFKDLSETQNSDRFFCSLCGFSHVTLEDFEKSKEWDGVCWECYLSFVEARRKE